MLISALKIHMSENAHTAIMAFPEFMTECRGEISVKVVRKVSCCNKLRDDLYCLLM